MNFKRFAPLAATLSLCASAAFAQGMGFGPPRPPAPPPGVAYGEGRYEQARFDVRRFDDDRRGGHYELRTVQQWVPGQWVRVPCHGGYRSEWRAGYYTTVQQWVFIERPHHHHRYGRR